MGTNLNDNNLSIKFEHHYISSFSLIKLFKYTLSLPIFGFSFCVLYSLIYSFEKSTATHCRVNNYLPSTSAAIGTNSPQVFIWRLCIALHCGPRFLIAFIYKDHYMSALNLKNVSSGHFLINLIFYLNIIENMALVLLTFVSSKENYEFHEKSFITFLVTSELYMILTLILSKKLILEAAYSIKEKSSFNRKLLFLILNFSSCIASAYFFYRHNVYCETGVYTLFALCEYVVIFSNIFFHGTAILDFNDCNLSISYINGKRKPS